MKSSTVLSFKTMYDRYILGIRNTILEIFTSDIILSTISILIKDICCLYTVKEPGFS